jgi:hypothetical protein
MSDLDASDADYGRIRRGSKYGRKLYSFFGIRSARADRRRDTEQGE